ncbi:MAG: hypothetical protein M3451_01520 [Chloroflexota bacterium]|nr:hypothetical protein [Chloroflexota bacterium]
MKLQHTHPTCTGRWHQQSSSRWMYWRCEQCNAIADHSVEIAEAALREHQLGTTLQRLADAGDWLRANEEEDLEWLELSRLRRYR